MDNNVIGALVVIALVLLAFWGMYRSWKHRTTDSATTIASVTKGGFTAVSASSDDNAAVPFSVLYVATTPTDSPLQRLNLPGLGFRAKTMVLVCADVIEISPAGEISTAITASSFLGVRSARVTIDRVVEKDGLTALDWVATNSQTGHRSLVTSYFRIPNLGLRESFEASLEAFVAAHTATIKEVAS